MYLYNVLIKFLKIWNVTRIFLFLKVKVSLAQIFRNFWLVFLAFNLSLIVRLNKSWSFIRICVVIRNNICDPLIVPSLGMILHVSRHNWQYDSDFCAVALRRAKMMTMIKTACLPKLICELTKSVHQDQLSEMERSLLNLIRYATTFTF